MYATDLSNCFFEEKLSTSVQTRVYSDLLVSSSKFQVPSFKFQVSSYKPFAPCSMLHAAMTNYPITNDRSLKKSQFYFGTLALRHFFIPSRERIRALKGVKKLAAFSALAFHGAF